MPGPVLTEDPLLGLALGHYRLTEKIGSGGMGVVYRAHDEHLDREVAIKVLLPGSLGDETQRKHFRKEALALSKLNHPNIATIHDFDTQEGVDFLVMEYIPGISLSDAMGPAGLPENEVLRLGVQLAEALSAAHEQGVVHRDLKPGNLRLTGEGGLKILDFGLAKVLKPISEGTTTESALDRWAITGTLGYMAPEQVTGEKIDARTDIHAAGLVLYEMATGHRPFAEVEVSQLINAILHRTPPSPGNFNPRLSPELVRIIGKCLEKEPGNRYQSAKELAVDLRRLAAAEFPKTEKPAPPPTVVKRTWPRAATYTAIALLAAGLLLALNVGGLRERLLGGAKAEEGIRSVLALPSTVYAPKDDAFLAEAIPNTLSAQLTEVQGLETKMPPTSAEVERMGGDIGRIANAYGADALVLSSVMAQDGKLVVNLRLVEARNRRLRWSHDYEGTTGNYLGLVREAANGLEAAIFSATTSGKEAARTKTLGGGTAANSGAELSYQRGLYYGNRYNNLHRPEDFDLAFSSLRGALELDPKLADAAANIAWLHEFKIESGTGGGEARIQMEQWGRRALEIDPKNSRAWGIQVIAELLGEKPDMSRLVAAGLRSAAFGPRNSLANNVLGMALSNHSVLLTLEAMQRAQELDPLYLYPPLNIADIYAHVGRTDEALRQVNEVLQIEPDMPAALAEKQLTFIQMGRVHDAEELAPRLEKYVAEGRLDPASISRLRDGLTLLQGDDRKKKAALEHLAKLWALEADRTAFYEYYAELSWLVRYGGTALAIDATTRRLAHGGTLPYDFLETAADLEPLRQDPRASRIAAQSKAQFEALVSVLQEARARGELPAYMERPLSELLARLNLPAGT